MLFLREAELRGVEADIEAVRLYFGSIAIELEGEPTGFHESIRQVYQIKLFDKYAPMVSPLYVLVPERTISCVWPNLIGDYSMIKYGTSKRGGPAVYFCLKRRGGPSLYCCLSTEGHVLDKTDLGWLGI